MNKNTQRDDIPCIACGALIHPSRHQVAHIDQRNVLECCACGLQILDPQPNDEELSAIYQEEYFDAWGIALDENTTRQQKRATFRRFLKPLREQLSGDIRLLDCGAATGFLMEEAAELGMDPYGVELSEYGANRIAATFGRDKVYQGGFDDLDFGGDTRQFDIVTMIDFLEHVRDPRPTLAKAAKLLKQGGYIVILTPEASALSCRLMRSRWPHYKHEHLFYYTVRSLTAMLQQNGFASVKHSRARKIVSVHYLSHQLSRYQHIPLLSNISSRLYRHSSSYVRNLLFAVTFGEMLVIARKK